MFASPAAAIRMFASASRSSTANAQRLGRLDPVLAGSLHVRRLRVVVQQHPGATQPGRSGDGHLAPTGEPRLLHRVRVHDRAASGQAEGAPGVGDRTAHVRDRELAAGLVVLRRVLEHHLELGVEHRVLDQVERDGGDAALERWAVRDDDHPDPAVVGSSTQDPRRVADHGRAGGHVVDHHGAGADDGVVADLVGRPARSHPRRRPRGRRATGAGASTASPRAPRVVLWRSVTSLPSRTFACTTRPVPCQIRRPGPASTDGGRSMPSTQSTTSRYSDQHGQRPTAVVGPMPRPRPRGGTRRPRTDPWGCPGSRPGRRAGSGPARAVRSRRPPRPSA